MSSPSSTSSPRSRARTPRDKGATRIDDALVQVALLEPALRLAEAAVAKGRLAAIGPLMRVLAQLDKYAPIVEAAGLAAETQEPSMAKLNRVAAPSRNAASKPSPTPSERIDR